MTARAAAHIYTIGHSNHGADHFIALLRGAGIGVLADVRSRPYSRYSPHFNRAALETALAQAGIAYAFLGDGLGGKPHDPELLAGGKPDYAKIAASAAFQRDIGRLLDAAAHVPTAIMCAERDPLQCHRTHLIAPALLARGHAVCHILADGSLLGHDALIHDALVQPGQGDLFT